MYRKRFPQRFVQMQYNASELLGTTVAVRRVMEIPQWQIDAKCKRCGFHSKANAHLDEEQVCDFCRGDENKGSNKTNISSLDACQWLTEQELTFKSKVSQRVQVIISFSPSEASWKVCKGYNWLYIGSEVREAVKVFNEN